MLVFQKVRRKMYTYIGNIWYIYIIKCAVPGELMKSPNQKNRQKHEQIGKRHLYVYIYRYYI